MLSERAIISAIDRCRKSADRGLQTLQVIPAGALKTTAFRLEKNFDLIPFDKMNTCRLIV